MAVPVFEYNTVYVNEGLLVFEPDNDTESVFVEVLVEDLVTL